MNLEIYLFWGLILFFAVGGLRMKIVAAFCLTVSSSVALYLSFWQIEHYAVLGNLLPREYSGYAEYTNPCLFVLLFFLLFFILQIIFKSVNGIYERTMTDAAITERMIFSKWVLIAGTVICNALTGVVMTTMLFLIVAVLPLASQLPKISAKKMAELGSNGMYFVSAVVDTVSLQPWHRDKKALLMHRYLHSEEMDAEEALRKM